MDHFDAVENKSQHELVYDNHHTAGKVSLENKVLIDRQERLRNNTSARGFEKKEDMTIRVEHNQVIDCSEFDGLINIQTG